MVTSWTECFEPAGIATPFSSKSPVVFRGTNKDFPVFRGCAACTARTLCRINSIPSTIMQRKSCFGDTFPVRSRKEAVGEDTMSPNVGKELADSLNSAMMREVLHNSVSGRE